MEKPRTAAAVSLGKPRSCREFLPHYWFPLLSKLFQKHRQLVFCTDANVGACALCNSLYGNLLVRTFFKLVSDLVVVVLFERERKHKNDLLTQCSCDI